LRFFDLLKMQEIDRDFAVKVDHDVAYSPTAPILAVAAWEYASVYHLPPAVRRDPYALTPWSRWVSSVGFSADGRLSVAFEKQVQIWDFPTGRSDDPYLIATLRHEWGADAVRFAPDGRSIATGDSAGNVRRWNLDNQAHRRRRVERIPFGIFFAMGGDRLKVFEGDSNGNVDIVRDLQLRENVSQSSANNANQWVAKNPCRKFKVQSDIAQHLIWDATTGELKLEIRPHQGFGLPRFSPDCKHFAFAFSKIVRIWSCDDWSERVSFVVDVGTITAMSWSPDGRTLAIGGVAGIVDLWNAAAGRKLLTLANDMWKINSLAFSPDGRFLAAGAAASRETGDLRIWNLASDDVEIAPTRPIGESAVSAPDGP
jgi:WD40 repeat protein